MFYPIGWHDVLEGVENRSYRKGADKISLAVTGIRLGSSRNNLVNRAYRMLDEQFDLPPVKAHLHKTIPTGAGLGGGSSDAAFFIELLDSLFNLKIPHADKKNYAAQLGSDCAFFIENKPVFARGKGDVFSKTALNLDNYFFVVVYPAIHSNTAEAYKGINPAKPEFKIEETIQGGLKNWKDRLGNDFEHNIFFRFPELENVKTKFYEKGALYASMSGSGSAVFGIFDHAVEVGEFGFPSNYISWSSAVS